MIKLSNRLANIASLIPKNANVIDIGCDHALLDIYLYQNSISKKIIASDINANALNNAQENIKKYKLENIIETRLGSGLDTLNDSDNIDTIIISGMGAHTIVGILKNNPLKLKNINTIIIQSNTKLAFLRKKIVDLNYMIEDELIIDDNKKVYTIIKFQKGKKKYTKKELYFGPVLLKQKNAIFNKYYKQELAKLNILLKVLPQDHLLERYKLKKEKRLYQGIIE